MAFGGMIGNPVQNEALHAKGCSGDVLYPATSEVQGVWDISQISLDIPPANALLADHLVIKTNQLTIGSNVYAHFYVPPQKRDVIDLDVSFYQKQDSELTIQTDL